MFAHITRCTSRAVRRSLAGIAALPIIAMAASAAVAAHCTFLARPIDTGSVSTAFRVAAARRRLTSQNGHTVSHRAVVLVVSAGVALPAFLAAPHRLKVNLIVGADQAVRRRLLCVQKSNSHLTPRAAVISSTITLARLHLLEFAAILLPLHRVTSIVEAAGAVPHAQRVGGDHHRGSEAERVHFVASGSRGS